MATIRINKNSQLAYMPNDVVEEGFVDEVELLKEVNTLVLIRPGSTIKEQIESLEHHISCIKRRERLRNNR
jgi:hypothetical protein